MTELGPLLFCLFILKFVILFKFYCDYVYLWGMSQVMTNSNTDIILVIFLVWSDVKKLVKGKFYDH